MLSTGTISSPVERIATRGFFHTSVPPLQLAPPAPTPHIPAASLESESPAPRAPHFHAARHFGQAAPRSNRTKSPSRCVCSTITTASAPAGTAAPVIICTQVSAHNSFLPDPRLNLPGTLQRAAAPTSSANTAYPSRVDRSNGGYSRSVRTSCANTYPSASPTRSCPWRADLSSLNCLDNCLACLLVGEHRGILSALTRPSSFLRSL